jgi:hypothetical protein
VEGMLFHVQIVDNDFDCRIIGKDERVGSVAINASLRRIASSGERRVESGNQRWNVRDSIEEGTRMIRDAFRKGLFYVGNVYLLHNTIGSTIHCNV